MGDSFSLLVAINLFSLLVPVNFSSFLFFVSINASSTLFLVASPFFSSFLLSSSFPSTSPFLLISTSINTLIVCSSHKVSTRSAECNILCAATLLDNLLLVRQSVHLKSCSIKLTTSLVSRVVSAKSSKILYTKCSSIGRSMC